MADQKNVNELLKEANRLKREAKKILDEESKGQAALAIEVKKNNTEYKNKIALLREVNTQIKEQQNAKKEVLGSLMQEEQKIKSFTGLQQSITGIERKKVELLAKQNSMHQNQKDAFGRISQLNQELLELSAEDVLSRSEISRQIELELDQLDEKGKRQNGLGAGSRELLELMKNEYAIATSISNLTQDQQKQLEAQISTYESMKTAVGGVLDTLSLLTSNINAAFGGLLVGAGILVDKFADINKELGNGFDILNKTTWSAGLLGFAFEDTAGTVKALASEFGDIGAATFRTQANIGLMAANMGISNAEAVSLSGSFSRLNNNSTDISADMIKTTQQFAKQNGIIPSTLMADLAGSTEQFALFGRDGGENILRAAGYAAKLGTNMSTLSGIAEGLLDFESSITKELELGALLGRNINLNKARELAFAGKIEEATKATLEELGGIEAFNEMDIFQRKAAADLLGVSVGELQKMVSNQENANSLGTVMNEKFSTIGETIDAGLNKYLGTGLKGLGGMITMAGQLNFGFQAIGTSIGGLVKGTAQVLKNIVSMAAPALVNKLKGIGSAIGGSKIGEKASSIFSGVGSRAPAPTTTPSIPESASEGSSKFMESISKIDMNKVLKGAAALVIVAGAVFVFGKAVQEFMKVSWEAVGMAVVSMLALVGAVILLGLTMSNPLGITAMLVGASAMLIIASSVLVLGHALQAIGTGFEMMSSGIGTLMPQLMAVATTIGGLVTLIPSIGLLALYIGFLAASIIGLGIAGLLATPGIMLLSLLTNSFISVGNSFEMISGGISSLSENLREITKIISDLVLLIPSISLLALSIGGLSASLIGLGVAGLVSTPGLLALSTVGAISTGIGKLFGSDEEEVQTPSDNMNELITEIKGLRADLNSGKVAVYLDGKKVTASISREVDRSTTNSYAT